MGGDQRSGTETLPLDWPTCVDGAAMLRHAAAQPGVTRQRLVLAACACARLALVHVPSSELRPLHAIEAAEAWARGEREIADVRAATAAASAASGSASAYAASASAYAAYAASAASDAAYAASTASTAAASAASDAAAYAASDAAYAASWNKARAAALRRCADAVRVVIPCPYHEDCLSLDALAVACGGRIAA